MKLKSIELLNNNRFDIPAKYIYAKYRENGYDTSFGEDVYKEHLRVWNGFDELDNPNKKTYEDFKTTFDKILDSISKTGFNSYYGTVPVTSNMMLLNGAHRVAAGILYNRDVEYHIAQSSSEGQLNCSSDYFKELGLDSVYMDAMATEYAVLDKDTLIVTLFPSAVHQTEKIGKAFEILNKHSSIVYVKNIPWSRNGALNFVRQLYLGEEWGLGWQQNFAGFARKAELCYTNDVPMITVLIKPNSMTDTVSLKEEIRSVFGCGKHSCHINDIHEETIQIARTYFNDNSIHHANKANFIHYTKFQSQFEYYKNFIKSNNLNPEKYCITASSVLSLYGLREGQDLDYLHDWGEISGHEDVHSHNNEIEKYTTTRHDILYNPKNHFWHDGVKVASLGIIRELKEKRNEPKDIRDVELVGSVL